MPASPDASRHFRLWIFHVLANALPSGILAWQGRFNSIGAVLAMTAVTAAFVLVTPRTPFWPLYRSRSDWGRSMRTGLWIRSVTSLLLLSSVLRRAYTRGWLLPPAFIEVLAGAGVSDVLGRLPEWSRDLIPPRGIVHTALMTLFTGLILLGVACVVAVIVRGIIAFSRRIEEDNRARCGRSSDY